MKTLPCSLKSLQHSKCTSGNASYKNSSTQNPIGLQSVRLNYINEPLVRKDICKFISYCRDKGIIDIMFSSNAVLLKTREQARELIEAGVTRIQFSVDAQTPETYQKVRRGTTLDKVHASIELFLSVKAEMKAELPLVRVNFVRGNDNAHEMDAFVAFWKERKIDLIAVQHHMRLDVNTQNNVHVKNFSDSVEPKMDPTYVKFKCASPFRLMTIRNSGEVLPCCTFYGAELPLGDAKSSIKEIWQSEKFVAMRKLHSEGRYIENDVCKRCVESHSNVLDE